MTWAARRAAVTAEAKAKRAVPVMVAAVVGRAARGAAVTE